MFWFKHANTRKHISEKSWLSGWIILNTLAHLAHLAQFYFSLIFSAINIYNCFCFILPANPNQHPIYASWQVRVMYSSPWVFFLNLFQFQEDICKTVCPSVSQLIRPSEKQWDIEIEIQSYTEKKKEMCRTRFGKIRFFIYFIYIIRFMIQKAVR